MAELINGKELAEKMQADIAEKIQKLKDNRIHPGLVVLLVGENPASQIYVRNKRTRSKRNRNPFISRALSETISENELLAEIEKYNQDLDFMVYWSNYHCQSI